jgi:hypothetical protein
VGLPDPRPAHLAKRERLHKAPDKSVPSLHREADADVVQVVINKDGVASKEQVPDPYGVLQISCGVHLSEHPAHFPTDRRGHPALPLEHHQEEYKLRGAVLPN